MAQTNRKVSGKEVVADIKAGTDDAGLMAKYELSPANLQVLFTKLVSRGFVTQSDLDQRQSPAGQPVIAAVPCPVCGKPRQGDKEECSYCSEARPKIEPQKESGQVSAHPASDQELSSILQERLNTEQAFKGGASWFYWIAGLSLVNSVIMMFGGTWNFIVGLGVTQFVGAIGMVAGENGFQVTTVIQVICGVINVGIAGLFVLFGIYAHKKHAWAFIVGMITYALDGLLFLLMGDYLGIGFHALALFFLFGGFRAMSKLKALDEQPALAA